VFIPFPSDQFGIILYNPQHYACVPCKPNRHPSSLPAFHDGDFGFGQVVELVHEAVDLAVGGAELGFELVEYDGVLPRRLILVPF